MGADPIPFHCGNRFSQLASPDLAAAVLSGELAFLEAGEVAMEFVHHKLGHCKRGQIVEVQLTAAPTSVC